MIYQNHKVQLKDEFLMIRKTY